MQIQNNVIGEWEVIHYTSLLVHTGVDSWIQFKVKNEDIKFNIKLVDTETKDKQEIELLGGEDYGILKLKNFNNALGTAPKDILSLAVLNDKTELFCLFINYRIGDLNKIDIQFMIPRVG